MPTYIFQCRKCGKIVSSIHGFDEPHPTNCECGGELQRRFSNPNVVFKGSGFYTNDKLLTPVKPDDYNSSED
jgi:putative FmdB family regulatory protein